MSTNLFNKGDLVEVELKNGEIYKGNVSYFDEKLIEICNVVFEGKLEEIPLIFRRTEIKNISNKAASISEPNQTNSSNIVEAKTTASCSPSQSSNDENDRYSTSSENNPKDNGMKLKITEIEFSNFTKIVENYVYITTSGDNFNSSLSKLTKSQSIGVVGLGITNGNGKSLSILALSTIKEIFIYDILKLKSLNELRIILESPYVTKIVHNGKLLYNHLVDHYHIKINNIFDTQVADSMISAGDQSEDITRSLSACLIYHYSLPELFDDEIVQCDNPIWWERPLTRADKQLIAYTVVFLRKLRNDLQQLLLKDVHEIIENDYEAYSSRSEFDVVFRQQTLPQQLQLEERKS